MVATKNFIRPISTAPAMTLKYFLVTATNLPIKRILYPCFSNK